MGISFDPAFNHIVIQMHSLKKKKPAVTSSFSERDIVFRKLAFFGKVMVRMKDMQVLISELNIPLENADSMVMEVTANQYKDTREKTFFP